MGTVGGVMGTVGGVMGTVGGVDIYHIIFIILFSFKNT